MLKANNNKNSKKCNECGICGKVFTYFVCDGEHIYLFAYKPKGDKHPLKLHNIEHYTIFEY